MKYKNERTTNPESWWLRIKQWLNETDGFTTTGCGRDELYDIIKQERESAHKEGYKAGLKKALDIANRETERIWPKKEYGSMHAELSKIADAIEKEAGDE